MKALLYSDLQATDGHERCFADASVPLQLWRVRRFYAELKRLFDKHACGCLWDLGDTTDDRSYLPMSAIDAVLEGLEPFPVDELNFKLIGNHEQYLRDTTKHIGRLFSHKFSVIHSTEVFEIDDNTLVVCAAYPASDAALGAWLSETAYKYRNYERKILLGHFQMVGCHLNNGVAVTGIGANLIQRFTLALLGHIHKPQSLDSVHYVGSPFQQNFGEKNEVKRVGVLDLETLALTWITLEGFPEYRVLDYPKWIKTVQKGEEHRYQVILRNPNQAEAYYSHPLMTYGEPSYAYELDSTAKSESVVRQTWTKDDVMRRWVERTPPGSRQLSMSPDDLLEVGKVIAET